MTTLAKDVQGITGDDGRLVRSELRAEVAPALTILSPGVRTQNPELKGGSVGSGTPWVDFVLWCDNI